ncbi:hypothetical protein OFO01_05295 [Campylobacter sp. JMF_01 NE2]|uniref:hypothetical protein n=1 Tax=unclassified Campylobacter TaxID=2593542 RepID=UPI0022E9DE7E|nr:MULTISPECIES: hypothetical protein [unclassified Campylobacter]MDA3052869.1 hypothetical protein [Campylobacter sp. JMF_03 NE3]MDA3067200.1 hypothetical protein [Campylobacter sp. JMF_01 NE2]
MKKLDNEKNNIRGKFLINFLLAHPVISAMVFFLPSDILSKSELCANFVSFMKHIFPNIEIFANVSKMPQVTEFYVSALWIWIIVLSIYLCSIFFSINLKSERISSMIEPKDIFIVLIGLIFGYMLLNIYFTAWVAQEPFGVRDYVLQLNSKLSNYFWIMIFSLFFPIGIFCIFIGLFMGIIILLNFKNSKNFKK